MNKDLLGILLIFGSTVLLALPLGRYLATIYRGEKSWTDFLAPLERLLFRASGIDANRGMTWQQHLVALLTINLAWFIWAMFVFCTTMCSKSADMISSRDMSRSGSVLVAESLIRCDLFGADQSPPSENESDV